MVERYCFIRVLSSTPASLLFTLRKTENKQTKTENCCQLANVENLKRIYRASIQRKCANKKKKKEENLPVFDAFTELSELESAHRLFSVIK